LLKLWPTEQKEAAQCYIAKYGFPDEITDSMLIWYEKQPWKKIVLHRYEIDHHFPKQHKDFLTQTINYKVPADKFDDLAVFDGSIIIDRTKGEISARCHDEMNNILSLNLAHDIITSKKTVREARDAYAQNLIAHRMKLPTPYMDHLRFSLKQNTADPDVSIMGETIIKRVKQNFKSSMKKIKWQVLYNRK